MSAVESDRVERWCLKEPRARDDDEDGERERKREKRVKKYC